MMCAIFGALGSFDRAKAEEAFASLSHRGPDDSYCFEDKNHYFAYHRLAIVAIEESAQTEKLGVHVSLNGEIYNYQLLKELLPDYPFKGKGDSEVVLAAYLTWGEAFVEKIEGMFSIAILDQRDASLRLFRDRIGKKPLYYLHDDKHFAFASEMKALLALDTNKALRKESIHSYLSFQTTLAPDTFYEGVYALQAGEKLLYQNGIVEKSFYDDIASNQVEIYDEEVALTLIESHLKRSVSTRVSPEVDTAFLLSGGVDSALLCALAQQNSVKPIQTFTVGYEGEGNSYDESAYAKAVADYIGAKNERVVFSYEDFKKGMKDIFDFSDQPLNDPAQLPLGHLCHHIKKNHSAKVIISGEGSDELFLGYRPYKEYADIENLSDLKYKNWLKNFLNKYPSEHREWEWYRRVLEEEILFRSSAESLSIKQRNSFLKKNVFDDIGLRQIETYYQRLTQKGNFDPLHWYRYIDLKVHQGDYFLNKLDRVSMHYALEARTPFLDESLVKESFKIDSNLFLKDDETKYLLKQVASNYLPKKIVYRKKKGFSYPFIAWLEKMGGIKEMAQLNDKHQLFDSQALKHLLSRSGQGAYKQHIFGMYLLLRFIEDRG